MNTLLIFIHVIKLDDFASSLEVFHKLLRYLKSEYKEVNGLLY